MDIHEHPSRNDEAHDDPSGVAHLNRTHPLATVAAGHCARHLGRHRLHYIGGVACGACWERAIRDDERVMMAFELPPLRPDPSYIDDVAVELLCRGDLVTVTRAERVEAVRRLVSSGMGPTAIARRLRMAGDSVYEILVGLREAVPFVPAEADSPAHGDERVA
jgi:hypothetical protein